MKVTYLDHSGFCVETSEHRLVFDYYRGGINIPDDDKTVIFFVSHFHEDHYNRDIYAHASRPETYYVLSREVRGAPAGAMTTYVRPNSEYDVGGVRVTTLRSTDCGVAYLVFADGEIIYHAGDLHLWVWNGASPAQNRAMEEAFTSELSKLRGIAIDAAFLPLDPRQEADGVCGFDYAMRTLDIRTAFPMHFWGHGDYVDEFCASDTAASYRDRIVPLTCEGAVVEI